MKTIYKYPIPIENLIQDTFVLKLPDEAKVLHIDTIENIGYIWCLVDLDNKKKDRLFRVYETEFTIIKHAGEHVGTYLQNNGSLVWHIFDLGYLNIHE
jgi:hypothetical protein